MELNDNHIKRWEALLWWSHLEEITKYDYWEEFKEEKFTPSTNPNELTGREIEIIYKNKYNETKN